MHARQHSEVSHPGPSAQTGAENSHSPQPETLPRSDNTEAIASYSLPRLPTLLRVFYSDVEPVFESQSALAPVSISGAASELVAFFSDEGRLKSLKDAVPLPPVDRPGFTVAPEADSRPLPHSQIWLMGFDAEAVHRVLTDAENRVIESISRGDVDGDAVQGAFSEAESRALEILLFQEHQGDVGGGDEAVVFGSTEMRIPALHPSRAPAYSLNPETGEIWPNPRHHSSSASPPTPVPRDAIAAPVPRDRPKIWHGSYRDALAHTTAAPISVPATSTTFPSPNVDVHPVSPVTAAATVANPGADPKGDPVQDAGKGPAPSSCAEEMDDIVIYMRVALPLQHQSDPYCIWSRFLRIALYFQYATSTEPQTKASLLQALERVHNWAQWASCTRLVSSPPLQLQQPQLLSTAQQLGTETQRASSSFATVPASTTPVLRDRKHVVTMLSRAAPEQQTHIVGCELYYRIVRSQPQLAGKITGMLLEALDVHECLTLIDSPLALDERVKQALEALQVHSKPPPGRAAQWFGFTTTPHNGSAAQSAPPQPSAAPPSEQRSIGFDSKDFVGSTFRALRENFPEDRRFFDFEFSKMCEWLDFQGASWSDPHITVPVHGVHILGAAGSVHAEDADRFLSHPTVNPFSVIEAFILPPRFSTDAPRPSSICRALSSRMHIPSVQFTCGHCSVVVVLSSIDVPSLRFSSACSLLPIVGPRMSEPLVCAILCMCQQALVKEESSSVLLQNEETSIALLAALQRCLDPDAFTPSSPPPPGAGVLESLVEIDALDQTGHWYHAFIVKGTVSSSDFVLVHFMVPLHTFLEFTPQPPHKFQKLTMHM
jgi:hypothetical protein